MVKHQSSIYWRAEISFIVQTPLIGIGAYNFTVDCEFESETGLEKRQPMENSVVCLRNRGPTITFLPILHHRLCIDPEQLRQAATICQGHLQGSQIHIP